MAEPPMHIEPTPSSSKAILDAQNIQEAFEKQCQSQGHISPPYRLLELIGKGSFGRVYKSQCTSTTLSHHELVAVKIINIDDGDWLAPGAADTISEILNEISALKELGGQDDKNINTIVDTLLVNHSVWIVTEYCAGGSVATLMKAVGALEEAFIIPILRETATAVQWIHHHQIIHRDIKAANILVAEDGRIQLCDFGVAGILQPTLSKRKTVTGTLHWMAPELFDKAVEYGKEVDIWAYGSMAYEIATGLPPNARDHIDLNTFGSYLEEHSPRLEGDAYSDGLKDIIAQCLMHDRRERPDIAQVQQHAYVFDTSDQYPTSSLQQLVEAYREWESSGGQRRSLWCPAVPGQSQPDFQEAETPADVWDFDTLPVVSAIQRTEHQDKEEKPTRVLAEVDIGEKTTQPRRGRRIPPNMEPLKKPVQTLFDPNSEADYREESNVFYAKALTPADTHPPLHNPTRATSPGHVRWADTTAQQSYDIDEGVTSKPNEDADENLAAMTRDVSLLQTWIFPKIGSPCLSLVEQEVCRHEVQLDSSSLVSPCAATHATSASSGSCSWAEVKNPNSMPKHTSYTSLVDLDAVFEEPLFEEQPVHADETPALAEAVRNSNNIDPPEDGNSVDTDSLTSCTDDSERSAFYLEKELAHISAFNAENQLTVKTCEEAEGTTLQTPPKQTSGPESDHCASDGRESWCDAASLAHPLVTKRGSDLVDEMAPDSPMLADDEASDSDDEASVFGSDWPRQVDLSEDVEGIAPLHGIGFPPAPAHLGKGTVNGLASKEVMVDEFKLLFTSLQEHLKAVSKVVDDFSVD